MIKPENAGTGALRARSGVQTELFVETYRLSEHDRLELIACIDEGSHAWQQGVSHGANPYLDWPAFGAAVWSDAQTMQMYRLEAWWDGWEELDRALPRQAQQ